jgi:hypothetical protein
MDKARRALLNLSLRYPLYGVPFTVDETEDKLLFCETEEAAAGICRILCDLRYSQGAERAAHVYDHGRRLEGGRDPAAERHSPGASGALSP